MCGLSGIISDKKTTPIHIENSLQAIKHRGPDDTLLTDTKSFFATGFSNKETKNIFTSCKDNSSVWLGFNRLSIVDLSKNAMQPFYDKKTDCYFMMNGEVYNYKKLRKEKLVGVQFTSNSDSEVAFQLYLKYGDDFIDFLQGMFVIVIFHKKEQKLKVWRDRLGIKPFYYYSDATSFIFSSEIKGLFSTDLVKKAPNYQGISYSMYLGTCPAPLTIYNNIFSLQGGHKLEYTHADKKIACTPYWTLQYHPTITKISYKEFAKDVTHLCKLYETEGIEKAIMLSGGIDSGTLAYFYGSTQKNLKALTIFQKNSNNNELEYTIENANNGGLELQKFEVPLADTHTKKYYFTTEEEPSFSPEPALFLSKKAKKQKIKILYNALGPDEVFGGYGYYQTIQKLQKLKWILKRIPLFILPKNKKLKLQELKKYGFHNLCFTSRNKFSWEKITSFLITNKQDIPEHPIAYLNKQICGLYPGFKNLPELKKTSYLDIFYYISSHHTFRTDVPSMLFSIEMRFPFLDHTFIEKYFNQSETFENIQKQLKPNMYFYAKNYLSHKVLHMQKKGFSIDVDNWTDKSTTNKEWYTLGLQSIFPKIKM